jgi:hyperosmotically inducible protein
MLYLVIVCWWQPPVVVAGEKNSLYQESSMKKIIITVLLCMGMLLSGCASMVTSGFAGGEQVSDGRSQAQINRDTDITNRVNRAFIRDPMIPAFDIKVRTYKGVVTLSGIVASDRIRRQAVQVARNTAGVNSVRSYLNLR